MAFPSQSIGLVAASAQYATANDSATLDVTGNLTIETWVKFTSTPASTSSMLLGSKWLRGTNQRSYEFQLFNNGGTLQLRMLVSSDGSTNDDVAVNWTPSTGTWYHVAMVYTAATSKYDFYVGTEGVSDAQQGTQQTGTKTSIFNGSAKYYITSNEGDEAAGLLDGRLCLMRVWSEARSLVNINTNRTLILGSTTNLSAEYTFDNVYTDNSGNANTLTAANTPTFSTDVPAVGSATSLPRSLLLMVG